MNANSDDPRLGQEACIPLAGGNASAAVVRIGDTVRRSPGSRHSGVARLLDHLAALDFDAAPKHLGRDASGREVLSFLRGQTRQPATFWNDLAAAEAAAQLLRRFHDASASLPHSAEHDWAYVWPDRTAHEVICHNDPSPFNIVFAEGMPRGLIDFDLAGPGPRLYDLGFLAYWVTPLDFSAPDMSAAAIDDLRSGSPRLHAICDAYDITNRGAFPSMVAIALDRLASPEMAARTMGDAAARRLESHGHFAHWRQSAIGFADHQDQLTRNLMSRVTSP